MNFKALSVKSKSTERQDFFSIINGKPVYKYKKKKRFGKSINRYSPGYLQKQIEVKYKQYNGIVINVDLEKYRASQYNHKEDKYIKEDLNTRVKLIGNNKVQRDLYAAFLLKNIKDLQHIDNKKCKKEFKKFLEEQDKCIKQIRLSGDRRNCFGLSKF